MPILKGGHMHFSPLKRMVLGGLAITLGLGAGLLITERPSRAQQQGKGKGAPAPVSELLWL